jgi:CIC family chloride channel protein
MGDHAVKPTDHLSDFTRDRRILVIAPMALAVGVLSAGVAALLVKLIALATNLAFFGRFSAAEADPAGHALGFCVVLVPMAGGLIIGLMARFGSEKIRGHGIPEALEAILIGRSRMDPKVALLKPLSSAISIGTGGPFGAEGPIIMTGGAFASLFAQLFHLSAAERKTLLVAGAAGGMAAIFSAPVAAVLLAVELLLFEWRPRSFIPVAISACTAGLLRGPLLGPGPIFPTAQHAATTIGAMGTAVLIGLVAGLGAMALTAMVYGFEDLFHRLRIHWMWWPMLGGLAVGVGGWIEPRAFGVGYADIHGLLRGEDLGGMLPRLLLVKALIWAVALGSGTSGGVLAPLLIIGGALGALEARLLPGSDAGFCALIGMAAMMGGTMRSPLTALIFAVELTHDVAALPALLAGCAASHAVTVIFMRRSILTEKVARRGHHLMREYAVDPLQLVRVGEMMDPAPPTVPASMRVAQLSRRLADPEDPLVRHHGIPVLENGELAGIITRKDLSRALEMDPAGRATVLEAGTVFPVTVFTDDLMDSAVNKMLNHDVGRLPVVLRTAPRHCVGYLGRSAILAARQRRLEEEQVRELGWRRG